MNPPTDHSPFAAGNRQVLLEVALVFVVFFVQGATPVPDVNEPYYLGRAIRFWQPGWAAGDFFLCTDQSHRVFYFAFGWLSLWLSPTAMAWVGRLMTWLLMAWAWRRLSFAAVPRRWYSVLTAALLVAVIEHCHMAGEWLIGGVEAKGFAYVLVLLGLEALLRNRWNRTWLLLGAAASFHVLVGGWAVVAAAIAWIATGARDLRSMLPGLLGGLVLSLPGLLPSLLLNFGTEPDVIRQANMIYVFERLYHHLSISQIPGWFVARFLLLTLVWLVLCRVTPADEVSRRLRAFVAGTLVIALVGVVLAPLAYFDQALCAAVLRFYWFRLIDVVVPLGTVLTAASLIAWKLQSSPRLGRFALAAAIVAASVPLGLHAAERLVPRTPRADRLPNYVAWRRACNWVVDSRQIDLDAKFLTPRMTQTFKWYTKRPEVANWKEIPQDAAAIVEWRLRMRDLYATGWRAPAERWHEWPGGSDFRRLKEIGDKYDADYVITFVRPQLPLEVVYRNRTYVIYRLPATDP